MSTQLQLEILNAMTEACALLAAAVARRGNAGQLATDFRALVSAAKTTGQLHDLGEQVAMNVLVAIDAERLHQESERRRH